jgi:hypothetical protein
MNVEKRKSFRKTTRDALHIFLSCGNFLKNGNGLNFTSRFFIHVFLGFIDDYIFKGKIKKIRHKIDSKIEKKFIIKTDEGSKFESDKVDSWFCLHKYYEYMIQKKIQKNIEEFKDEKDKIFLDIGAHIGKYLIPLTKKYNYIGYGFEPSKKNL